VFDQRFRSASRDARSIARVEVAILIEEPDRFAGTDPRRGEVGFNPTRQLPQPDRARLMRIECRSHVAEGTSVRGFVRQPRVKATLSASSAQH
jgi:hypothetical protein